MTKKFETVAWPGYWEGTKPIINLKTATQKLKFSFLQREEGEFVCVFISESAKVIEEYLDNSLFTDEKYSDSSGYYNWPIKTGQVIALQSDVMRVFSIE
ncbi:MAG: hypothetical protein V7742_21305 [Halioglobus sp.]